MSSQQQRIAKIKEAFEKLNKKLWKLELGEEELDLINRLAGDVCGNVRVKEVKFKEVQKEREYNAKFRPQKENAESGEGVQEEDGEEEGTTVGRS